MTDKFEMNWKEILTEAIEKPGIISDAYTQFHNYSIGNRILVAIQCMIWGKKKGPMNSYGGWKKLGRQVQKGESGMWIYHPIMKSYRKTELDENGEEMHVTVSYPKGFTLKKTAFVISQTDGEEVEYPEVDWDREKALKELDVEQVEFWVVDGNSQGVAKGREVAVSPVAKFPLKTLVHEVAHVIMGHTRDMEDNILTIVDGEALVYSDREVEAECVAYIVTSALDLDGQEESRGYIQNWLKLADHDPLNEEMSQRIFGAANKILQAGS